MAHLDASGDIRDELELETYFNLLRISANTTCKFCGEGDNTSIHILSQRPVLLQSRLMHQNVDHWINRHTIVDRNVITIKLVQ